MARLAAKSIGLITYTAALRQDEDLPSKYATGFFTETAEHGRVCVTCAHVLAQHPGPDRDVLYVNGLPTRLVFDASRDLGIDIALLEVPPAMLNDPEIHFHRLGSSRSVNRVYYSHGWNLLEGFRNKVKLVKVWGPRMEHSPVQELPPRPVEHSIWVLRNDVFDHRSGRSFSTRNFAPGWSGAPVFNVRPAGEEDRVIGVLSVVAEEGARAVAVSVERLDFLRPAEEQAHEGRVGQAKLRFWEQFASRMRPVQTTYEIRFDDEPEPRLFHLRFTEITQQPVCPPVPEPPSPYDSST